MSSINMWWWWRHSLVAGAATTLFLTSACGGSAPASQQASSGPCRTMPASDVPPLQKALTERDHGTYCASVGVTILVVLKARDFGPATSWSTPTIDGPSGGVSGIAPPLTALRGSTIAAMSLSAPGTYTFRSATPDHESWQAVVTVS